MVVKRMLKLEINSGVEGLKLSLSKRFVVGFQSWRDVGEPKGDMHLPAHQPPVC